MNITVIHGIDPRSVAGRCRADKAYDLWKAVGGTICLTGRGSAEALDTYLENKGVPNNNRLTQSHSTSTIEDFYFTSELLRERDILTKESQITYVSNWWHFRVPLFAFRFRLQGKRVEFEAAPDYSPKITLVDNIFREALATGLDLPALFMPEKYFLWYQRTVKSIPKSTYYASRNLLKKLL